MAGDNELASISLKPVCGSVRRHPTGRGYEKLCTCWQRCNGGTYLSSSNWSKHKKYRDSEDKGPSREFLKRCAREREILNAAYAADDDSVLGVKRIVIHKSGRIPSKRRRVDTPPPRPHIQFRPREHPIRGALPFEGEENLDHEVDGHSQPVAGPSHSQGEPPEPISRGTLGPGHSLPQDETANRDALEHVQDHIIPPEPDLLQLPPIPEGDEEPAHPRRDASPEPEDEDGLFDVSQTALPEDPLLTHEPTIEHLRIAQQFVLAVRNATLDDGMHPVATVHRIRNPPTDLAEIVKDPIFIERIESLGVVSHSQRHLWDELRRVRLKHHPDEADSYPSLYKLERRIEDITGISPREDDTCVNSCVCFVGPYAGNEVCPKCGEPRWDPVVLQSTGEKKARKVTMTILLAFILQALWGTPHGAKEMRWLEETVNELLRRTGGVLAEFEDIFSGSDILELFRLGLFKKGTSLVSLQGDGFQLYHNKKSDMWVFCWKIDCVAPEKRYKKRFLFPAVFVPGPNKPKDLDSFMFPSFHHLSAIQKEGLRCWDGALKEYFMSTVRLLYMCMDTLAKTAVAGTVGHLGLYGCRLFCSLQGRRQVDGTHYYPARLCPLDFNVPGSDHPSVVSDAFLFETSAAKEARYNANLTRLLRSRTASEYRKLRLETGLVRPSLVMGLPRTNRLSVPDTFPIDTMHLGPLNTTSLMWDLWLGKIRCLPTDCVSTWDFAVFKHDPEAWQNHGILVGNMTAYIPSFFGRTPRNPAEKLNTEYKANEWTIYALNSSPATLYGFLPSTYYMHWCKFVSAARILFQRRITVSQLQLAAAQLTQFTQEFEELYYQGRNDRLHFVRQCIHNLLHAPYEIPRVGSHVSISAYTIERIIGLLTDQLRQHSDQSYANIANVGVRMCQQNLLKIIIPELAAQDIVKTPRLAIRLPCGRVLLHKRDRSPYIMRPCEVQAFRDYCDTHDLEFPAEEGERIIVRRWARLSLPNGHIGRCAWKEKSRKKPGRIARHVGFSYNGDHQYGEVQYYFRFRLGDSASDPDSDPHANPDPENTHTLAVISMHGPPDDYLAQISQQTLHACQHGDDNSLVVVSVDQILSVIAFVPFPPAPCEAGIPEGPIRDSFKGRHFVMEKTGVDILELTMEKPPNNPEYVDSENEDENEV